MFLSRWRLKGRKKMLKMSIICSILMNAGIKILQKGLDKENIPKYDDLSIMMCPDFDTYPDLV